MTIKWLQSSSVLVQRIFLSLIWFYYYYHLLPQLHLANHKAAYGCTVVPDDASVRWQYWQVSTTDEAIFFLSPFHSPPHPFLSLFFLISAFHLVPNQWKEGKEQKSIERNYLVSGEKTVSCEAKRERGGLGFQTGLCTSLQKSGRRETIALAHWFLHSPWLTLPVTQCLLQCMTKGVLHLTSIYFWQNSLKLQP